MARVYQLSEPHPTLHDEDTMEALRRVIDDWDGQAVAAVHHPSTGSWIFIAFHDITLGPAVGGCRINTYNSPLEGLKDAMRLAESMTFKWATLGVACGGGKAVLALSQPLQPSQRAALVRFFGEILERLRGAFWTGGDLGTTLLDLDNLRLATRYLHCFDAATGRPLDSGIYTALGVAVSIRVAIEHVFGNDDLSGRTILVQGIGQVGSQLARRLYHSGATVLISDVNVEKIEKFQTETGCAVVAPDNIFDTACDVYAPCAAGGSLNELSVARMKCAVVAGGANNQLLEPAVADRLHERGILYAPDYVVNAGGAIGLWLLSQGSTEEEARRKVAAIGDTLTEILSEAAGLDESPLHVARRRAEAVLSGAREHAVSSSDDQVENLARAWSLESRV